MRKSDADIDAFTAEMRAVGEAETATDHDELVRAVRTILRGFDECVFVRSIDGDTRPDWAVRLFPFIQALAKAQELVGGDQCLGEDCPIHGGPNQEGR